MQIRPRRSTGAKTAERAPTTTDASPETIRSRSSRRSASVRPECSTAIRSPKRAWKRPSVCGVSAISGTSTIAPRPARARRRTPGDRPRSCRCRSRPASRRWAPPRVERLDDARDRLLLRLGQLRRLRLACEPGRRSRAARLGGRAASARRARARAPGSSRSSRRPRARDRRAPAATRRGPTRSAPSRSPAAPRLRSRRRRRALRRVRSGSRRPRPSRPRPAPRR